VKYLNSIHYNTLHKIVSQLPATYFNKYIWVHKLRNLWIPV